VPIGEKNASESDDGDIIQFASGLDVHGSDIDGKLVLSYGIHDCILMGSLFYRMVYMIVMVQ